MTKTERETLELLAKGYVTELKPEDVSLAARRVLEEIDGINVNCCGRGRPKKTENDIAYIGSSFPMG